MTLVITPAPTPVFNTPDGVNAPENVDGWTVQSANGSDQNLVSGA
jgi:hypothetical protein